MRDGAIMFIMGRLFTTKKVSESFQNIHDEFPEAIARLSKQKFRVPDSLVFCFINHYYLIHKGADCCGLKYVREPINKSETEIGFYEITDDLNEAKGYFKEITEMGYRIVALNDNFMDLETQDFLKGFMTRHFPTPSSFENSENMC